MAEQGNRHFRRISFKNTNIDYKRSFSVLDGFSTYIFKKARQIVSFRSSTVFINIKFTFINIFTKKRATYIFVLVP